MDQPRPKQDHRSRRGRLCAVALLAGLAAASGAEAQSMSSSGSQFNRGYGFGYGELNRGIDVSTRDLSGNKIIVDGVTAIGSDQSVFSRAYASGAADAFSGAGAIGGSGQAIGNNLQVTVSGNHNTVVVNSQQTNNGDVSATTVLNGKVNIDGN